MAAKMVVYNKKYKKIFPETDKSRDLHAKCLFYQFLNYRHHSCDPSDAITQLLTFQDGVQDRSQQIFQSRGSGTLHVGIMMDL